MGIGRKEFFRGVYGVLIPVVVLQAVGIGLAIRYAGQGQERDRKLLERSDTMMEEIFPGIQRDLSHVSQQTAEIKSDISGLRDQVSHVDDHVGLVGTKMDLLQTGVNGFIHDTSGFIWGHSVNPYLLLAILLGLAASIVLWLRYYHKKQSEEAIQVEAHDKMPLELLSGRLEKLSDLVERIRAEEREQRPGPELQRLMHETERLIQEARTELAHLSLVTKPYPEEMERAPDTLH